MLLVSLVAIADEAGQGENGYTINHQVKFPHIRPATNALDMVGSKCLTHMSAHVTFCTPD